jgi:hypothetical protein
MDPWLTDQLKEQLFAPCMQAAAKIGRKLDNRLAMKQSIDERALTEQFIDSFDTSSSENVWGGAIGALRDLNIYLQTTVRKSTFEHKTGADIGLVIDRSVHASDGGSHARYATLIQCKKIDADGTVQDFFHQVGNSRGKQSSLLVDLTPSAFYFIFTPPSLVEAYGSIEPIGFVRGAVGCSSPVWNCGAFGFPQTVPALLSSQQIAESVGILVVPALAVEAQRTRGRAAAFNDIISNCLPFWYWFGELLIPGFVGDRRVEVIRVAENVAGADAAGNRQLDVKYSVGVRYGTG